MAEYSQDNRLLQIDTPLGKDFVLINGFGGTEKISGLFRFDLQVMNNPDQVENIPTDALLGEGVTVRLDLAEGARFFHGVVSRFSQTGQDTRFRYYQAEVVPWLWLLTLTSDCRVFQFTTVPDVVKTIFDELQGAYPKLVNYRFDLRREGGYTAWDYCVQHRETDFNFVSRLLEQEGIFYFFEFDDGSHTLVLTDDTKAATECPHQSTVLFAPEAGTGEDKDTISGWQVTAALRSEKYAARDYHIEMPSDPLDAERKADQGTAKFEIYDYPGEYAQRFNKLGTTLTTVQDEGKKLVRVRMEEEQSAGLVVRGVSDCRAFTAGTTFTRLLFEELPDADSPYLLTSVSHSASQNDYQTGGGGGGTFYNNSFTCAPQSKPFRPVRLTPRPVIQGLQNAVVVGVQGTEYEVDRFGRVKVQFKWDRRGEKNEKSSCWVRVAQPWAGCGWGTSFWPRIGQEVFVAFLDGDPEQPIIVASAYNAEQVPPYLGDPGGGHPGPDPKHPHNPQLSGIKTNTTPGGKGFNELRFDDTKGKQQVFVHAERNMDVRVKNDSMERVIGNRHLIVGWTSEDDDGEKKSGGDQRELVNQDKHLHVKRDQVEKIEGNFHLTVGKGDAADGGKVDVLIEKDKKELIEQNSHLHVKQNRNESVGGAQSLTVGGDQHEKVTGGHALEAGKAVYIKAGTTLILEAGTQLSLKVGGNFIDIGPAGVSIVGTMVMINSGGSAGSGTAPAPAGPADAQEAKPADPAVADDAKTGFKSALHS